ncbi:MAG TPA: type I 3-dehydroquinate dehydratase [Methanoculleus sp.]|nr:type I 3-dehydroquinate dehydratase [Methanoculleus sp.]
MKTVVALTSKEDISEAASCGADLIELRIDLFDISPEDIAAVKTPLPPLIVTLRSREEGGRFDGTPEEWLAAMSHWCGTAAWIDVERKFSNYSRNLTKLGSCGIISSAHLPDTPGPEGLAALEAELRDYGDVPKIIVTPHSHHDVLCLLAFTLDAPKPVCTGAMGDGFRYARAVAPLVGSEFVYCHFGTPTAPGQYHIDTMKNILEELS